MRKLLFILVALAAALLLSERDGASGPVRQTETAVLSAGHACGDQWQCERLCNSDLGQPRVLRAAEAAPAARLFERGGAVGTHRAALRNAACGCGTGVAKIAATYRSSDLSAGRHAVDYYVYRLRRLLI